MFLVYFLGSSHSFSVFVFGCEGLINGVTWGPFLNLWPGINGFHRSFFHPYWVENLAWNWVYNHLQLFVGEIASSVTTIGVLQK